MDTDKANKIVKKFIQNNTYPEYNDVVKMLTKNFNEYRERGDKEFAIHYLNLFSEYGQPNHEWMKEIYENITNEEIIKANGEKIYNRGGALVMQSNYYTIIEIMKDMFENKNMKHDERVEILYPIKEKLVNVGMEWENGDTNYYIIKIKLYNIIVST